MCQIFFYATSYPPSQALSLLLNTTHQGRANICLISFRYLSIYWSDIFLRNHLSPVSRSQPPLILLYSSRWAQGVESWLHVKIITVVQIEVERSTICALMFIGERGRAWFDSPHFYWPSTSDFYWLTSWTGKPVDQMVGSLAPNSQGTWLLFHTIIGLYKSLFCAKQSNYFCL